MKKPPSPSPAHGILLGLDALQLDYHFHDPAWLELALRPPSAGFPTCNQRLEFVGDGLLQACTALMLHKAKPDWNEGQLSKLRSRMVNTASLRAWAEDIGIILLKGPRSPRKPTPEGAGKPLADAMEALLAAIYFDAEASGQPGLDILQHLVTQRFQAMVETATQQSWIDEDPKTALQERTAALGLPPPCYTSLGRTGPDHQPIFKVQVAVDHRVDVSEGATLKKAQMEAARRMLQSLSQESRE